MRVVCIRGSHQIRFGSIYVRGTGDGGFCSSSRCGGSVLALVVALLDSVILFWQW